MYLAPMVARWAGLMEMAAAEWLLTQTYMLHLSWWYHLGCARGYLAREENGYADVDHG